VRGTRNGVDLREYYEACGLGVESLFLRYIAGALKPGGRAFVIVPLGMLNRTDPKPKAKILQECDVIASIALPRNTFFNTSQLTYILLLEKRHSSGDARPDVFCAIARSIGETLDYRRIPIPHDNDLEEIANAFVAHVNGDSSLAMRSRIIKIVQPDAFTCEDRWDVARFWSEHEYVQLGIRESAIARPEFIDEVRAQIAVLSDDLVTSRAEIEALSDVPRKDVFLSDRALFSVRSGTRITNRQIHDNPGDVIVYSCFKSSEIEKGKVSRSWLAEGDIPVESRPVVTVNANGASIGKVFTRYESCVLTDDVIIVEPLRRDIDVEFLAHELRSAVEAGNFIYEAKLFVGRVRQLSVRLPAKKDGSFDIKQQRAIGNAIRRFDNIRHRIQELGEWAVQARIS